MTRILRSLLLLLLAGALAVPAFAQTSTATIRGKVTNDQNAALAGAQVTAVGTTSGFVTTVKAGPDGAFQLGNLTPGEYIISVSAQGFEERSQTVTVLVGQSLNVTFVMTPNAVISESITVVGEQAVDIRTPEASTNVTPHQIENLPQDDRNFLNFATMAPGVRMSNDPLRKTISSDAQPAEQTNVFIDGISFKNDVLLGGLVGQDTSRGNPFPQNAVQEFRVITQNYSAQYEKASSAVITAVTKSGGNDLRGQLFWFYQPSEWVSELPQGFQYSTLSSNPDYKRSQPGVSIGGPIIKDKLHYFLSYEGVDEHATTGVNFNPNNPNLPSSFPVDQYAGVFPSPFKSNLGFGKLSWQPAQNQLVDFSGNYRKEHEIRDFGGMTSYQAATDLKNQVWGTTLRHSWNSDVALNQLALSWQDYTWNQAALNPDLVGLNYEGAVRVGGKDTSQKFDQKRTELRDDYNFPTFQAGGDHSLQVGGNADFLRYAVTKFQNGNPVYNFKTDPANGLTPDQPYEALFGFGNPNLSANNQEYGVYGQDTWTVSSRLTINLGLRYDYETHQIDDSYVTPANIVAGLTGKIDSSYFSNGHNRSQFKNQIQPRLGFSYDLRGDGKSILVGGAGRYYDRIYLNATLDERFRLQYPVYRIEFSPNGQDRNGAPTIMWDPRYLTPEGLHSLIASGQTSPEVYLLNNNTKPPYSDQWNLGVRQAFGNWTGSLSYNSVRGYHGFTWLSASGICCAALVPGYGNVIISDPEGKRYWYDGIFFTLDRPFVNNWSVHVAYTHADAKQTGNDLFSLDYPSAAAYGKHDVPGSEKDRIVANAIVGLPWEMRFSTTVSLGSGAAFNVLDFSQGFSLENRLETRPFDRTIYPAKTWGFADRTVDFHLEKEFRIKGDLSVAVVGEIFNAFNWASYGCLDNFIGPGGNSNFGNPSCVINLPRREQVGLKINF